MQQPRQLFISYSHNDISFVQQLKAQLERDGYDVWIDVKDIRAGEDWGDAIQRGLDEATQMVLVVSPASMHSRRVRAEWRYFLFRHKHIVPILIAGEESTLGYELLSLQFIDFTAQPFEQAFPRLQTELQRPATDIPSPGFVDEMCDEEEVINTLKLIRPPYLHPRSTFVSTAQMISRTREQLWVSGIAVNRVLSCNREIMRFLQNGGTLRVLFPCRTSDSVIADLSDYLGQPTAELDSRLGVSEGTLKRWLALPNYADRIRVRRLPHRPSLGYFIRDPHLEDGMMTVSPYFYKIDERVLHDPDCEPPYLYLERRYDQWWFETYRNDFESMWEHPTTQPWP